MEGSHADTPAVTSIKDWFWFEAGSGCKGCNSLVIEDFSLIRIWVSLDEYMSSLSTHNMQEKSEATYVLHSNYITIITSMRHMIPVLGNPP